MSSAPDEERASYNLREQLINNKSEAIARMVSGEESNGLMGGNGGDSDLDLTKHASIYRNFVLMCLAFSFNHGCVVSCLAYSTTELGTELGGYGSGVLYVFYAFTALLFSKPLIAALGARNGLLVGMGGYCVYVAAFLFAVIVPAGSWLQWTVFLIACAIGGIAGGLLWTAQGRYFARNSSKYSEAMIYASQRDQQIMQNQNQNNNDTNKGQNENDGLLDYTLGKINATFAGTFAMCYLGVETMTKALATLIFLAAADAAPFIVFTVYASIAFGSVFMMYQLSPLGDGGSWDLSLESVASGAGDAVKLCYNDVRLALMLPYQVTFGFVSTFVPFYVFGIIVNDSSELGGTWVGLLSALITLTGASMGLPAAYLANNFGKPVVMVFGGICIFASGFIFYFITDEQLGTWGYIIPYLIMYGIGRGTWENTNKAVIADLYMDTPNLVTSAFASVAFSNGFSGALAYFTFPSADRLVLASVVSVSSVIGIICYLAMTHIEESRKRNN